MTSSKKGESQTLLDAPPASKPDQKVGPLDWTNLLGHSFLGIMFLKFSRANPLQIMKENDQI